MAKTHLYGLPGIYNTTIFTLSDGEGSALSTDASGRILIGGGGVASGATDSGNPVKVGGVYNSSAPTLTDGQRGDLQLDAAGNLKTTFSSAIDIEIGAVEIKDGTTDARVSAKTDNTAAGTPVVLSVGGKYNASAQTYDDGDQAILQTDINGNTLISSATKIAGEDLTNDVMKVEQRFSYAQIAAGQATTTVKSGAGFLHAIVFNGPATATNVTTVYDNTAGSGTVIAIPLATAVVSPTTVIYDVSFATGLTIVTATANGANMTISYR